MVDQVFESVRQATELVVQGQQEMFRRWTTCWMGIPVTQSPMVEQVQAFQKKWAEACMELFKKQWEVVVTQFGVGLKAFDEVCRAAQAKDADLLRGKMVEFWQRSFESLRQLAETQMRDYQSPGS